MDIYSVYFIGLSSTASWFVCGDYGQFVLYLPWQDLNGWCGLLTTMKRSTLNRSILQNALLLLVWINICYNFKGGGGTNGLAAFMNTFVTKPGVFSVIVNASLDGGLFFLHSYRTSPSWECWDVGSDPNWLLRAPQTY